MQWPVDVHVQWPCNGHVWPPLTSRGPSRWLRKELIIQRLTRILITSTISKSLLYHTKLHLQLLLICLRQNLPPSKQELLSSTKKEIILNQLLNIYRQWSNSISKSRILLLHANWCKFSCIKIQFRKIKNLNIKFNKCFIINKIEIKLQPKLFSNFRIAYIFLLCYTVLCVSTYNLPIFLSVQDIEKPGN